jgi:pilus assembly protein CpaC
MPSSNLRDVMRSGGLVALVLIGITSAALAADVRDKIRIPVGHAEVVQSDAEVRTVAIGEQAIADAAVGSARTVVVNAKAPGITNLVVYNEGGRYKIYEIEVYIPNLDKEVMLHVNVSELSDRASRVLGFDFYGSGRTNTPWIDGAVQGGLFTTKVNSPSFPLDPGPATDGIIKYGRNDGRLALQVNWQALEQSGDIRTLANPTLVARSGEQASFLSGGEFPVPISTVSSGTTGSTVTIQWREFGVKVVFTPTVLENGAIQLKVAPEVSQLDFSNPLALNGFVVPILISRKASTTVTLNAGENLVIGGLKQTEKSKTTRRVPFIGRIPLLGLLFTSQSTSSTEKDLLIVVSPEMVDTAMNTMPPLPTDRPERK